MNIFKRFLVLLLSLSFLLSLSRAAPPVFAQNAGEDIRHNTRHNARHHIREAVFAGKFYPSEPRALKQQIRRFSRAAGQTDMAIPEGQALKALILPHAGYAYSGPTAAHACRVLTQGAFSKVVIVGPDHRVGFANAAVSDVDAYETPLGEVPLHKDAVRLRKRFDRFRSVKASDKQEHCIEVILPFLQYSLTGFQMVPVVLGRGNAPAYTSAIETIYDKHTLLVVSSDLSHYLSYEKAKQRDRQTIEMILNLNAEALAAEDNRACGAVPIQVLLKMAQRRRWQPVLLHYENSGDTAGPRRQVVGYAAIAFYGEELMTQPSQMSEENGKLLVELARRTIARRLGADTGSREDLEPQLADDVFQACRGTFVTLTKNNQLRGCIGNLAPDKPVRDGVEENAINAAFHDPRFPALSRDEFDQVHIEISLLSEPRPLDYKDADDLLARLRPHVDGVILRKGAQSATFLPQVWEQLPDKEMFLSHLCLKAGLPGDAWKKGDLEILTYQVQYFEDRE